MMWWIILQLLLVVLASHAPSAVGSSVQMCRNDEREALLAFKTGFAISNTSQWPDAYAKTNSWSINSDCCKWDGVTCDSQTGHVVELDLSCSFLTGSLPSNTTLFLLPRLRYLGLSINSISSTIPSWIWTVAQEIGLSSNRLFGSLPTDVNSSMLTRLSGIEMSDNMITGMIPGWIFTLPSLNSLSLDENLFTGIGEFEIGNDSISRTSLTKFWAQNNRLQGKIPDSIFNLHNLQSMYLERSNLTGTIPLSKIHKLQSMESLSLSDNDLSIIDDMGTDSISSWPSFRVLLLSSCKLGHFPGFLREQVNLEMLELSNNDIHGVVPHWLLDIGTTSLVVLNLSHNSLSGGLEHLPWKNLEQIDIGYNLLQGALPVPSPSTIYFWASNNRFTGEIPPPLCDISRLALLDLSQNYLTGNIPDCFTSLISQQMLILDLRQNQLQGIIPSFLFQDCPNLFTLSLSDNKLEGPIPQSLNNCLQLQLLDLRSNKLNDTFPHWLGILPLLEVLILGSNNLHDSLLVSKTTSSFPRLRILDISNNDLTGSLPDDLLMSMKAMVKVNNSRLSPYMGLAYYQDSITAWVKGMNRRLDAILDTLVLIDASENRLDGPIPDAIGDLASLRWLNLAHNNFTGHIPTSLSNLTLLEALDLSYNRLGGGIPTELVNLKSLEVFNVSENDLVGPVPTGKQFDTFLDNSYLGNPGLCGPLLTNKCRKPNNAPPSPPTTEGSSEGSLGFWEIGLMGCGCGMLVGLGWGYLIFWKMTPYWVQNLIFKTEAFLMVLHRRRHQKKGR